MQHVVSSQITTATSTELVAAPGAGKKIVVFAVYITTDTQQLVNFDNGTTLLHAQYCAANSGQIAAFNATPGAGRAVLFECSANTALNVDTAVAGNCYVSAWYDVVDA